ncbi:hypothetical protein D3C77_450280 [compost metagenome]
MASKRRLRGQEIKDDGQCYYEDNWKRNALVVVHDQHKGDDDQGDHGYFNNIHAKRGYLEAILLPGAALFKGTPHEQSNSDSCDNDPEPSGKISVAQHRQHRIGYRNRHRFRNPHQHTAEHHHPAERNDKSGNHFIGNEPALHHPQYSASCQCTNDDDDRRKPHPVAQNGGNPARQTYDRADRQVDMTRDDNKHHSDGQNRGY